MLQARSLHAGGAALHASGRGALRAAALLAGRRVAAPAASASSPSPVPSPSSHHHRRWQTTTTSSSPPPLPTPTRYADFRSDTVTKPTAQMTIAMIDAQVGDDVYGEDPTVNQLEALGAQTLEKEAALYLPSCTMANLVGVGAHLGRGQSLLLGDESHIFVYEQGGASWIMGAVMHTVPNEPNGTFALEGLGPAGLAGHAVSGSSRSVLGAIEARPDDQHYSPIGAVAVENTHNRCGGAVLPLAWLDDLAAICKEGYGDAGAPPLPLHMDGARLINASTALGVSPARACRAADSVSLCLSKGLGAPAGALLVGPRAYIARARRLRKALGGGMRQAGVLAASGIVALKEHPAKLAADHARAKGLARGLAAIPGVIVNPSRVPTNIVFFDLDLSRLDVRHLEARIAQAAAAAAAAEAAGAAAAAGKGSSGGGGGGAAPVLRSGPGGDGADVSSVLLDPRTRLPPATPYTTAAAFARLLEAIGRVRVGSYGTQRLRAVTHHQLGDEDVETFLAAAAEAADLLRAP